MTSPILLLNQQGDYVSLPVDVFKQLQSRLTGNLVTKSDSRYEQARKVWSAAISSRPALVAMCENEQDVSLMVQFVRTHSLAFSVRAGGHNVSGKSLVHDGVVINLSLMNQVEVDAHQQTVRVKPGALLRDVDTETSKHNLVVPLGVASTTGVIGLTLGGGMGRTSRKFGLTCDNLMSARVILADGNVVTASNQEHQDLFWALRGGCGNFGVVTEMIYLLHPIPEKLFSGKLIYDETKIKSGLQLYRKILRESPDEVGLDVSINLDSAGKRTLSFSVCITSFDGGEEKYLDLFQPLGKPLVQSVLYKTYPEVQHSDHLPFGSYCYYQSGFTQDLSDGTIDVIIDEVSKVPPPETGNEFFIALQQLSGVVGRVPNNATAFAHRDSLCNIITLTMCKANNELEAVKPYVDSVSKALSPYYSGSYANDSSYVTNSHPELVFGENYERLKQIKKHYDPDNIFNRSIRLC